MYFLSSRFQLISLVIFVFFLCGAVCCAKFGVTDATLNIGFKNLSPTDTILLKYVPEYSSVQDSTVYTFGNGGPISLTFGRSHNSLSSKNDYIIVYLPKNQYRDTLKNIEFSWEDSGKCKTQTGLLSLVHDGKKLGPSSELEVSY